MFDHILSQKNGMKKECDAFLMKVQTMLGDNIATADLTKHFTGQLIEAALDREIEALDDFIRSNFDWGGMRLRHSSPVRLQRLPERPVALRCGHIFCETCCHKLTIESDDDSDPEYNCPMCKETSSGYLELYF